MKVLYRQAAADDVVRQIQYYLVEENIPGTAVRFRDAVQYTLESLHEHPRIGPLYRSRNAQLQGLRSWPVAGFEAIRLYYLLDDNALHVIRVLHGKRDLKHILESEETRP